MGNEPKTPQQQTGTYKYNGTGIFSGFDLGAYQIEDRLTKARKYFENEAKKQNAIIDQNNAISQQSRGGLAGVTSGSIEQHVKAKKPVLSYGEQVAAYNGALYFDALPKEEKDAYLKNHPYLQEFLGQDLTRYKPVSIQLFNQATEKANKEKLLLVPSKEAYKEAEALSVEANALDEMEKTLKSQYEALKSENEDVRKFFETSSQLDQSNKTIQGLLQDKDVSDFEAKSEEKIKLLDQLEKLRQSKPTMDADIASVGKKRDEYLAAFKKNEEGTYLVPEENMEAFNKDMEAFDLAIKNIYGEEYLSTYSKIEEIDQSPSMKAYFDKSNQKILDFVEESKKASEVYKSYELVKQSAQTAIDRFYSENKLDDELKTRTEKYNEKVNAFKKIYSKSILPKVVQRFGQDFNESQVEEVFSYEASRIEYENLSSIGAVPPVKQEFDDDLKEILYSNAYRNADTQQKIIFLNGYITQTGNVKNPSQFLKSMIGAGYVYPSASSVLLKSIATEMKAKIDWYLSSDRNRYFEPTATGLGETVSTKSGYEIQTAQSLVNSILNVPIEKGGALHDFWLGIKSSEGKDWVPVIGGLWNLSQAMNINKALNTPDGQLTKEQKLIKDAFATFNTILKATGQDEFSAYNVGKTYFPNLVKFVGELEIMGGIGSGTWGINAAIDKGVMNVAEKGANFIRDGFLKTLNRSMAGIPLQGSRLAIADLGLAGKIPVNVVSGVVKAYTTAGVAQSGDVIARTYQALTPYYVLTQSEDGQLIYKVLGEPFEKSFTKNLLQQWTYGAIENVTETFGYHIFDPILGKAFSNAKKAFLSSKPGATANQGLVRSFSQLINADDEVALAISRGSISNTLNKLMPWLTWGGRRTFLNQINSLPSEFLEEVAADPMRWLVGDKNAFDVPEGENYFEHKFVETASIMAPLMGIVGTAGLASHVANANVYFNTEFYAPDSTDNLFVDFEGAKRAGFRFGIERVWRKSYRNYIDVVKKIMSMDGVEFNSRLAELNEQIETIGMRDKGLSKIATQLMSKRQQFEEARQSGQTQFQNFEEYYESFRKQAETVAAFEKGTEITGEVDAQSFAELKQQLKHQELIDVLENIEQNYFEYERQKEEGVIPKDKKFKEFLRGNNGQVQRIAGSILNYLQTGEPINFAEVGDAIEKAVVSSARRQELRDLYEEAKGLYQRQQDILVEGISDIGTSNKVDFSGKTKENTRSLIDRLNNVNVNSGNYFFITNLTDENGNSFDLEVTPDRKIVFANSGASWNGFVDYFMKNIHTMRPEVKQAIIFNLDRFAGASPDQKVELGRRVAEYINWKIENEGMTHVQALKMFALLNELYTQVPQMKNVNEPGLKPYDGVLIRKYLQSVYAFDKKEKKFYISESQAISALNFMGAIGNYANIISEHVHKSISSQFRFDDTRANNVVTDDVMDAIQDAQEQGTRTGVRKKTVLREKDVLDRLKKLEESNKITSKQLKAIAKIVINLARNYVRMGIIKNEADYLDMMPLVRFWNINRTTLNGLPGIDMINDVPLEQLLRKSMSLQPFKGLFVNTVPEILSDGSMKMVTKEKPAYSSKEAYARILKIKQDIQDKNISAVISEIGNYGLATLLYNSRARQQSSNYFSLFYFAEYLSYNPDINISTNIGGPNSFTAEDQGRVEYLSSIKELQMDTPSAEATRNKLIETIETALNILKPHAEVDTPIVSSMLFKGDEPGSMLAPNGQRSKLSDRNWYLVRTPQFKEWFGDWENDPQNSGMLDENGEPKIFWHGRGGNEVFTEVKPREIERSSSDKLTLAVDTSRLPFVFFSPDYEFSLGFVKQFDTSEIIPVFISSNNIFDPVSNEEHYKALNEFLDSMLPGGANYGKYQGHEGYIFDKEEDEINNLKSKIESIKRTINQRRAGDNIATWDFLESPAIADFLVRNGFAGINVTEGKHTNIALLTDKGTNVKSAWNIGIFDKGERNIYYQESSSKKQSTFGNWKFPSAEVFKREYEVEHEMKGLGLFGSFDEFMNAVYNGQILEVTPELDDMIEYRSRTQSQEDLLGLIKTYRSYPEFRNEETLQKIYDAFKSGQAMEMPIVVRLQNGRMRVLSGNTRMDAAFQSGVNPKVILIEQGPAGQMSMQDMHDKIELYNLTQEMYFKQLALNDATEENRAQAEKEFQEARYNKERFEMEISERRNLETIDQTKTKEFKNWFGDWENDPENSGLLDENGKPMVFYHSTPEKNLKSFDKSKVGSNTGWGNAKLGFFFSASKKDIKELRSQNPGVFGKKTLPVYLSVKNPIEISTSNAFSNSEVASLIVEYLSEEKYTGEDSVRKLNEIIPLGKTIESYEKLHTKEFADFLKSKGYDGIVSISGFRDEEETDPIKEYIVFEPNQIKHAEKNSGEFSLSSDDIYAQQKKGKPLHNTVFGTAMAVALRHPLHDAAKSGNLQAAREMIEELMAGREVDYKKTDVVIYIKTDETGNKIPQALAEYIAKKTGAKLVGTRQLTETKIGSKEKGARLFENREYENLPSSVVARKLVTIVDDYATTGTTAMGLREVVSRANGKVSQYAFLSGSFRTGVLVDGIYNEKRKLNFLKKFGEEGIEVLNSVGIDIDKLTVPNFNYLESFSSVDTMRDKLMELAKEATAEKTRVSKVNGKKTTLINADIRNGVRQLAEQGKTFDTIFLDPPYYSPRIFGGLISPKYATISPEQFGEHLDEMMSVAKDNTKFVLMLSGGTDARLRKHMDRYMAQLNKRGIYLIAESQVVKDDKSEKVSKPEKIYVFSRNMNEKVKLKSYYSSKGRSEYSTEKSKAFYSQLFNDVGIGKSILDPYSGSGNSIIAAAELGVNGTAIEKSSDAANKQIKRHELDVPLFQREDDETQEDKSWIKGIYETAKRIITLFKAGDVSTVMHELAHSFRSDLRKAAEAGNVLAEQKLKAFDDFAMSEEGRRFFEENAFRGEFSTDNELFMQELWARSFEKFLATGGYGLKASSEFKQLLADFRNWMIDIYKVINGKFKGTPIDVKLTDEMREMFLSIVGNNVTMFDLKEHIHQSWGKFNSRTEITPQMLEEVFSLIENVGFDPETINESYELLHRVVDQYKRQLVAKRYKGNSRLVNPDVKKLMSTPRRRSVDAYRKDLELIENLINNARFRFLFNHSKNIRKVVQREVVRRRRQNPEFYKVKQDLLNVPLSAITSVADMENYLALIQQDPMDLGIEAYAERAKYFTEMGFDYKMKRQLEGMQAEQTADEMSNPTEEDFSESNRMYQIEYLTRIRTYIANVGNVKLLPKTVMNDFMSADLSQMTDAEIMNYSSLLTGILRSPGKFKLTNDYVKFVNNFYSRIINKSIEDELSQSMIAKLRYLNFNHWKTRLAKGLDSKTTNFFKVTMMRFFNPYGFASPEFYNLRDYLTILNNFDTSTSTTMIDTIFTPIDDAHNKHRKVLNEVFAKLQQFKNPNAKGERLTVGQFHKIGIYWLLNQVPEVTVYHDVLMENGISEEEAMKYLDGESKINPEDLFEKDENGIWRKKEGVDEATFKVYELMRQYSLQELKDSILVSFGIKPKDMEQEDFENAVKEMLKYNARELSIHVAEEDEQYPDTMKQLRSEIARKRAALLDATGKATVEEVIDDVLANGLSPETEAENDFYKLVVSNFDRLKDGEYSDGLTMEDVANAYTADSTTPFVHIRNYAPIIRYASFNFTPKQLEEASRASEDLPAGAKSHAEFIGVKPGMAVGSGFTKKRVKTVSALNTNAFEMFESRFDQELFYMLNEPHRIFLKQLFGQQGGMFNREKPDEKTGNIGIDQASVNYIKTMIAVYFRRGMTPGKLAVRAHPGYRRFHEMTLDYRAAALSLVRNAIPQVTSTLLAAENMYGFADARMMHIIEGYGDVGLSIAERSMGAEQEEKNEFLMEYAPEVAFRGISDYDLGTMQESATIQRVVKGYYSGEWVHEKGYFGELRKWADNLSSQGIPIEKALLPMVMFDRLAARATFFAAYRNYCWAHAIPVSFKTPNIDAVDFALNVVRKTQNTDNILYKPGVLYGIKADKDYSLTLDDSPIEAILSQQYWNFKSFALADQNNIALMWAKIMHQQDVDLSDRMKGIPDALGATLVNIMGKLAFNYVKAGATAMLSSLGVGIAYMAGMTAGNDDDDKDGILKDLSQGDIQNIIAKFKSAKVQAREKGMRTLREELFGEDEFRWDKNAKEGFIYNLLKAHMQTFAVNNVSSVATALIFKKIHETILDDGTYNMASDKPGEVIFEDRYEKLYDWSTRLELLGVLDNIWGISSATKGVDAKASFDRSEFGKTVKFFEAVFFDDTDMKGEYIPSAVQFISSLLGFGLFGKHPMNFGSYRQWFKDIEKNDKNVLEQMGNTREQPLTNPNDVEGLNQMKDEAEDIQDLEVDDNAPEDE